MQQMNRVIEAARFAKQAHEGQVRKFSGDPYIHHPLRVAGRVMLLPQATEDMVVAALLHDVVEDTPVKVEEIRERFGLEVAALVAGLTHQFTKDDYPDLNRATRKRREFERLSQLPWAVRAIKLLDRIDNLGELDALDNFTGVYMVESQGLLAALTGTDQALENELRSTLSKLASVRQMARVLGEQ